MRSLKKNLILNIIKTISGILFPMLTFKYAANVLSTEHIGTVSFGSSVIGYFTLLAGLGISSYAVREGARIRDDKPRIQEFSSQVFSINCISCGITMVLLIVCIHLLPELRPYKTLLLIQSMVTVFTTIGTEWINIIYEDYYFITMRTIAMQVIAIICMFLFVRNDSDYLLYAAITVCAQVGMYLMNIFYVRKYVKYKFTLKCKWREHIFPILIIFSSTIAVNIYATLDVTMIGVMLSKSDVALYTSASKIYTAIKSVFAAVLGAIIPRLSFLIAENEEKYQDLLHTVSRGLIVLLVPCLVLTNCLSEELILLISGSEYIVAADAQRILSFAVIFSAFSTCIVNNIFLIKRRERLSLIATAIGATTNFILNLFFIPAFGLEGAAITTLISEFVVFIICIVGMKQTQESLFGQTVIISDFLKTALSGVLMLTVCCFAGNLIENYFWRLFVVGALGAICYICTMYATKETMVHEAGKMALLSIKNKVSKK